MGKVIAGLGVVLVTVIGGFLIYRALNETETQTATPISSPSSTAIPTPGSTPITDVPEDWETYSSDELGFNISHPSEMTVDEQQAIEGIRFLLIGPSQTQGTEMYDGISMTINVDTHNADSFQDFIDEQHQETNDATNPEVGDIEQVTVAGLQGYQFVVNSLGEFTHIYLPLEGNKYAHVTYLMEDPENQGFQEILDTMLSSLSFNR
jgi:hypothetical protein